MDSCLSIIELRANIFVFLHQLLIFSFQISQLTLRHVSLFYELFLIDILLKLILACIAYSCNKTSHIVVGWLRMLYSCSGGGSFIVRQIFLTFMNSWSDILLHHICSLGAVQFCLAFLVLFVFE